jgi:hypothetical protein
VKSPLDRVPTYLSESVSESVSESESASQSLSQSLSDPALSALRASAQKIRFCAFALKTQKRRTAASPREKKPTTPPGVFGYALRPDFATGVILS